MHKVLIFFLRIILAVLGALAAVFGVSGLMIIVPSPYQMPVFFMAVVLISLAGFLLFQKRNITFGFFVWMALVMAYMFNQIFVQKHMVCSESRIGFDSCRWVSPGI